MAAYVEFEIEGLAELQRWMEDFTPRANRGIKAAMKGALSILHKEIANYPPATGANKPPGLNGYSWYERGYGVRTVTGRGYPTSETLGRSWTDQVLGGGAEIIGILGTKASYAPFVQDEEDQAWFHVGIWPTVQDVLSEKENEVQDFFGLVIERLIREIRNKK